VQNHKIQSRTIAKTPRIGGDREDHRPDRVFGNFQEVNGFVQKLSGIFRKLSGHFRKLDLLLLGSSVRFGNSPFSSWRFPSGPWEVSRPRRIG
jgi:hypothetical protein